MKKSAKRGFTLAELTIALAVLAIVVVVVSSFTAMIMANTASTTEKLSAINDISGIETVVENWIARNAKDGASFTVENGQILAKIGEETYDIVFANNKIISYYPEPEIDVIHDTKTVKKITFDRVVKNGDELFLCTIDYTLNFKKRVYEKQYTFCVNPYIGEIVEVGGV